jgi:K+-sensing histidine kinase KdpD
MDDYNLTHAGPRGVRSHLWIIDESSKLLAANSDEPIPHDLENLSKPAEVHDITIAFDLFSLSPDLTMIRLSTNPPAFLAVKLGTRRPPNRLVLAPFILTFILVAIAVFLALSLTFFYLQRKSREAKAILTRLEHGDLKARFKIQRFDEIGSLMLDFNRMAAEIERLIYRVQATETVRRNLLQELSHDLRTPLTSLRTSVDTLRSHFGQMSDGDRAEFFGMIDSELKYFIQLVEDLFFIAELDEPRYKASTQRIDVAELLSSEIKSRQAQSTHPLLWSFTNRTEENQDHAWILGDPHLIRRLFKNALDNAAKYAQSTVHVRLEQTPAMLEVRIEDDGAGILASEAAVFGTRRAHRFSHGQNELSLGLGSVIMKTIAEIHDGRIEIHNRATQNSTVPTHGTVVCVFLPKNFDA